VTSSSSRYESFQEADVLPENLAPATDLGTPQGRRGGLTPLQVVVVGLATALGSLSIDLYLPAFPELATHLHTSEAAVQITLTACVIGLAVGQIVAGPLSDAWGRRVPIVAGLLGWGVASLLCAFAPSIEALTALRFAQGLAGAAGLVVSRAVVRDLTSGPAMVRAFARLMLIVGVVPILAPTVGGLLLRVMPWQGLFMGLAGFGLLAAVVVYFWLDESLPPGERRPGGLVPALRSYGVLLRDRQYVRAALVLAFAFAALFTYVSGSAFVMRTVYGLDATGYGFMFAAHSIGLVSGNQLSGRIAGRWRTEIHLAMTLSVAVVSAAALLVVAVTGVGGIGAAIGTVVFTIFGVGMSLPLASSIAMAGHPDRAGAASALLGLLQFSVGGLVAPLVGFVGTQTLLPLAVAVGGCLVVALALQLTCAQTRQ
jgi:DHA1 family bicyclomycin/chloramphenicol resistance-like MFS transporter